jgi:hypothetical protein
MIVDPSVCIDLGGDSQTVGCKNNFVEINQLAEQKLESVPYTAIALGFWFSDSMKSLMGPQDDIHGDHESQPRHQVFFRTT